jgi:riboflavin synthase
MFTGIVQEVGKIIHSTKTGGGVALSVLAPQSAVELAVNDSVAINGCCQTVIEKRAGMFTVEAVEETLRKTTLGKLSPGMNVNLELAMKLSDRLGGHLVLGHVDGVGQVESIEPMDSSWLFTVRLPQEFLRYVIPVGSIAVDGVSLTVARLKENHVTLSIIPHTFEKTIFRDLNPGADVNIECDLIGKYIERLMLGDASVKSESSLTAEKLRVWGYSA